MKRPMIEKIKSRLRSALNNAKYMTTGNLAHNKACVEMMVEYSLNEIDQIVVEERERCLVAFREWYCKTTCNHICDIKNMCTTAAEIRKAIEEGGEG